jgi:hypothetical protein
MGARALINVRWWGGPTKRPMPPPAPKPPPLFWAPLPAPPQDFYRMLDEWHDYLFRVVARGDA